MVWISVMPLQGWHLFDNLPITCEDVNANDDGQLNIADAVRLLARLLTEQNSSPLGSRRPRFDDRFIGMSRLGRIQSSEKWVKSEEALHPFFINE